jgi:hypothetical protein
MTGPLQRIKLYVSLILFYMIEYKDGHLSKLYENYEDDQNYISLNNNNYY